MNCVLIITICQLKKNATEKQTGTAVEVSNSARSVTFSRCIGRLVMRNG